MINLDKILEKPINKIDMSDIFTLVNEIKRLQTEKTNAIKSSYDFCNCVLIDALGFEREFQFSRLGYSIAPKAMHFPVKHTRHKGYVSIYDPASADMGAVERVFKFTGHRGWDHAPIYEEQT